MGSSAIIRNIAYRMSKKSRPMYNIVSSSLSMTNQPTMHKRFPYRDPTPLASGNRTPLYKSNMYNTTNAGYYVEIGKKWWYSPIRLMMRVSQ